MRVVVVMKNLRCGKFHRDYINNISKKILQADGKKFYAKI